MVELTLLLPPRERVLSGAANAILGPWVVRGDRLPDCAPGRDAVLRGAFEFTGTTIPAAALARSIDATDAGSALWLRADPAWVLADAVTLRLMACGEMRLSPAESDALASALKPLFGDAGFPLEPATPSRWYLRCPPGAQLPEFSPPQDALGDDIARHLPDGDSGRRWRHLLNEAQVILHNHPVNAERSRRGLVPVNSLWIWGGGMLPDWVRTPFTDVRSDDDLVRALGALATVRPRPLSAGMPVDPAGEATLLVDLANPANLDAIATQWLAPLDAAIGMRAIAAVELWFAGGQRYRYRHRHRWRLWRRLPRDASS